MMANDEVRVEILSGRAPFPAHRVNVTAAPKRNSPCYMVSDKIILVILVILLMICLLLLNRYQSSAQPSNLTVRSEKPIDHIYHKVLTNVNYTSSHKDWDLYLPQFYQDEWVLKQLTSINDQQIIFMLLNINQLTNKDLLWSNMLKCYGRTKASQIMPDTYLIPQELESLRPVFNKSPYWLIKKNIQLQKGIKLATKWSDIFDGIKGQFVIAQEFWGNPYLINGYKITVRVYVLVISQYGLNRAYYYQNGPIYYTMDKWNPNSTNLKSLITFYHPDQKFYSDKPTDHDQLLQQITREHGKNKSRLANQRMIQVLKQALDCVLGKLNNDRRFANNLCFQLFGADIGLDSNLQAKLFEINKGPGLKTYLQSEKNIKMPMIQEMFAMVNVSPHNGSSKWVRLTEQHIVYQI